MRGDWSNPQDAIASNLSRREMIAVSMAGMLSLAAPALAGSDAARCDVPIRDGVPAVDYHVHIGDGISIDQAVALGRQRALKFGLLQHAGVEGHGYAVSNDATLDAWIRSLEGQPVFKGIEGEGVDWMSAFSKAAIARLDYVQADPLAVPDASGVPLHIWRPEFRPRNAQAFMDRYLDYHLQLITTHPIDILAVPTFLPEVLRGDYDRLWTPRRTQSIIDALLRFNVALEIDSRFRVPSVRFLEIAKAAGVTFAFGSNYQTAGGLGDIGYGVELYKRLRLSTDKFFCPAPAGKKPVERR
jgi:histidinol phosphatase-like PHP family hydrolase